jgi:NAD(P)-dependent dehydrogenase (short-subunit alcohol dehydrogenase family)
MANSATILITGAGSGLGEGTAVGLARAGHKVIAGVQINPQVTALRRKVEELGLSGNLKVIKLNILDEYDVANALKYDVDVLLSNAGIGETGPIFEMPLELIRANFETNFFAPLELVRQFIVKWIAAGKRGKIVFTSSIGALISPPGFGSYVATKHALQAVAEVLSGELKPFNIQVQTINPGSYFTGINETMAETAFRWLDDHKHFTKRADMKATFDSYLSHPEDRMDPQEMIDAMIRIVPATDAKFRNVVPRSVEDKLKDLEQKAWVKPI